MKKLLSILTSIAVILAMMPSMAFATGTECTDLNCEHVATIENIHYSTLQDAINDANSGDVIKLISSIDLGSETLNVNKAVTIDGGTEKYAIESTASNVIRISSSQLDSAVILRDLTIKATNSNKTGRAIGIGSSDSISKLNLVVENCDIETTQRGITINSNNNTGIKLDVIGTKISLTNGITNYDEEVNGTNDYNNSRGISLWQMGNSEVNITDSTIQGFFYSINNAGGSSDNMTVNLKNSSFKGRAAINAHMRGTIWNITDCAIHGINTFSGPQEGFATIVLYDTADDNKVNINNTKFTTFFNSTGLENENATEYLIAFRGPNCIAKIDESKAGTEYTVCSDDKGGLVSSFGQDSSLVIYGGKYSQTPADYLPEGKYASKETSNDEALYVVHEHSTCNFGHVYCPYSCVDSEEHEMCHTLSHYVAPSAPKDPVTNEGTAGTDNATTNADITDKVTTSEGKAEAVVDPSTGDKIVSKAEENKSSEVVIEAGTSAGKAETTSVALPEATVKAIAEKTDASVTINTDNGSVTLDKEAVDAVAAQAGTAGVVTLVVETVESTEEKVVVELKLQTSNGYVTDFNGGNVSVTVPVNNQLKDKEVVCVYIDDEGIYHEVSGKMNADGTYTFVTGHFSTYAVMAKEDVDKVIADQTAKIKATTIKLKSTKGRGYVKLTWTKSGKYDLDGYDVYRGKARTSLKRWGGTAKTTYRNAKSLKKGTIYYYKVRGYKVVDGKKIYTKWSNINYRKAI